MSVFYELPDQLFKELSEFYVKYINVKQSNSEYSQDQDKNKFEVLFKQIEKIISTRRSNWLFISFRQLLFRLYRSVIKLYK